MKRDPSARINLHFNDFNHWEQFNFSASSAYVRGNAFINECLLNSFDIAERFSSLRTLEAYIDLSIKLNGFYSIVLQNDCMLYAAVDRVRSIPIFYCLKDGGFYISDNPHWIRREIESKEVDEIATLEFLLTGYVTGKDTLFPDIKQLQAGEALILELNSGIFRLELIQYHRYIPGDYSNCTEEEEIKKLDAILVAIFKRLIKIASGRTIVVPLSGGYDSRLVVLMLKRLNYDNVIAFSYGKLGNKESEISREVARSLGIQWEFVPYSNEDWHKWYRSEEFKKYRLMSCGLTSVPNILDWPAVWTLKRSGSIPDDCLFVPGHGADILSGRVTHIVANTSIGLIESIFQYSYSLWRCPSDKYKNILKTRIAHSFNIESRSQDIVSFFEYYRARERHPKYIINSVRTYEFWEYSWWMPFWDNEFMEFWSRIPTEMKLKQKIYIKYVNEMSKKYFDRYIDVESTHARDSSSIKTLFRNQVIHLLKKSPFIELARNVYCYYRFITADNYEKSPIGYFGAISKEEYTKLYTGIEIIESFMALDIVRSLSKESKNAEDCLNLLVLRNESYKFYYSPYNKDCV